MSDFEARLQQTFDRVKSAAADHAGHTLTLHMWEARTGDHNDVSDAAIKQREGEEGSLLNVMAGDTHAIYHDKGYLHATAAHRYQRGTPQGVIGLSTTPVSSHVNTGVFPFQSDTGLLMLDATPVYSGLSDAWSLYYDDKAHLPTTEEWGHLHDYASGSSGSNSISPGFAHLRDHPEDREALVGKLAIMGYPKTHPIALSQVTDIGKPYYLLDPLSSEQQKKARAAYTKVVDANIAGEDATKESRYPEICVNAKLDQVTGIVAMNFKYNPAIDPAVPISEALAKPESGNFVKTLYRALKEYDQLAEVMRKKGITKTPTLVISQPWVAAQPLVHWAPTAQLKEIVEGEMKKRGYLAGQGASPEV